ncbi:atrial natriuretic peptide receptor 1-like isoform X1, partial [Lates japonicus]
SVKILTYREPQNPEYKEFVNNLKTDAKKMFNYTVEDTLMNIITGEFRWSDALLTPERDHTSVRQ